MRFVYKLANAGMLIALGSGLATMKWPSSTEVVDAVARTAKEVAEMPLPEVQADWHDDQLDLSVSTEQTAVDVSIERDPEEVRITAARRRAPAPR